jgi:hypothetical protein
MTTTETKSAYLGDGAYADLQPDAIRLYAEREFNTHEVFLERDHLQALINFACANGYALSLPPVTVTGDDAERLTGGMKRYYQNEIRARDEFAAKCVPIMALLPGEVKERASIVSASSGGYLDLDNLNREEVSAVMHALSAGRWERQPSSTEGCIDYTATVQGVKVRLYAAAPPNSCRMVEVEEVIPAQPERIVKKRKLMCGDSHTEALAE